MLAHMFMDGADKKKFGHLLKNMSDDHALGMEKHLEDVETALQKMTLCSKGANKKTAREKKCRQAEDESPGLMFATMMKAEMMKKRLCFNCVKCGHRANQCKMLAQRSALEIHCSGKSQGEDAL